MRGAAWLIGLLPIQASAGTCALCREALASGANKGLLNGFYWSIILIVTIPLIVFAIGFKVISRHWR